MSEPEFTLDPQAEQHAVERIRGVRERRDAAVAKATLDALTVAAEGDTNLFASVLACVEASCTLGEIMQVLEDRWGTFQSPRG